MAKDVIVFGGALFDSPLWTNRQHMATRLAERGWRVLYVEPRLLLPRMLFGRFPGTRGRFRWLARMNVPWLPQENLWVVAQFNVLPWSREVRGISTFNHWLNAWGMWFMIRLLQFHDPVMLVYDTEAAQYLPMFPRARVVYDCVDDHRSQAGVDRNPARVEQEETAIAKRADAVAVITEPLRARFLGLNRNVQVVPNAADVESFLSSDQPGPRDVVSIPHPRIGTVGALDGYKIDVELLRAVALARPQWHVVLVGPVDYAGNRGQGTGDRDIASLRRFPNVHFLGTKRPEDIPAYVHAFDVAMIPYRESDYNRASFPLKFWEFMAAGKPVVSSGLPALAPYAHLAPRARTSEEFIAHIETALRELPAQQTLRVAEAERHDWATRVDAIERLLVGNEAS